MCGFLFRDQHFLVVLMRNAEGRSLRMQIRLAIKIGSWGRDLLHITFHPVWELLLPSETKPYSFHRARLETRIQAVSGLTRVLGLIYEAIGLGHAVSDNGFLESGCTLFIIDA